MLEVNELLRATKGRLLSGKRESGVKGISIDSRTIRRGDAFIAIKGDNFDGHDFIKEAIRKGARAVVVRSQGQAVIKSPAKIAFIEVKDTVKALGDIARFQRKRFALPVIAVTGSNGKTTSKDMIAWVLSGKFKVLKNAGTKNNHIGLPQTLLELNDSCDIAVVEIGTNHFGEVAYLAGICLPNIGVITNIGPSHLEYLRDLKGVLREKYTLIEHLKDPRIALINSDDVLLKGKLAKKTAAGVIFGFGIKKRSDFFATDIRLIKGKIGFSIKQKYKFTLRTLGYYNIYNALAAIALGRIFGMEYKDISRRLADFIFSQGRLNFVEFNKIKFIDDTYNSNPLSLRQALETLDNFRAGGRKIFVMGDMLELGKASEAFHRQGGQLAAGVCDVFITVGELSKFAAQAARVAGLASKNIFTCDSVPQARDILFNKISPGPDDIVLVKGSRSMKMEEILRNR
jgi:UDP-N-acetylmuramoyl-tripeptide--D-alanyl-D-alanine ligase